MTLCEVGASSPIVVTRTRVEYPVNGEKLMRLTQSKRNRCGEEHC